MHIADSREFTERRALRLAAMAHAAWKKTGRGLAIVRKRQDGPDDVPVWNLHYVGLQFIQGIGFSEDVVQAVRDYVPQCQAVLFVLDTTGGKLLLVNVECVPNDRQGGR